MSKRGRRQSSSTLLVYGLLFSGVGVIWLSPWWMEWFFPGVFVQSSFPWDLTMADLNWQRAMTNLIVKPGFRMWIIALYVAMFLLVRWSLLLYGRKSSSRILQLKELWSSVWGRDTGEFVVEGRRASMLIEFAREVGAV